MRKLWLDDLRPAPEGFEWVKTVEEAKFKLTTVEYDYVSLDNDLGEGQLEGKDLVDWIEEQFFTNPKFLLPMNIWIHSANPVASKRMRDIINRIYTIFMTKDQI